jgi:hypothetical protein
MVYFEQRVVLTPGIEERIDKLQQTLSAFYYKLPDLSQPIDTTAAINTLQSLERTSESLQQTLVNAQPVLYRIDELLQTVHMLMVFGALVFLFLVVLVVINMVLCYLVWKKSGTTRRCQCGKKEAVKLQ